MVRRTLQEIGREARQLRRQHGAGVHLPEVLRKAAVQLAASYDDEAITRELKISQETLRRWKLRWPAARVAGPRSAVTKPARAMAKGIDFVEIKGNAPRQVVHPESSSSVVEVTRPDGWIVRVTGDLAKDLATTTLAKLTH
jgi:hypothetical protein